MKKKFKLFLLRCSYVCAIFSYYPLPIGVPLFIIALGVYWLLDRNVEPMLKVYSLR